MSEAKEYYFKEASISYAEQKYDATENADALILLTEWKEFRSPDFEKLKAQLNNAIIFDGRNQYNAFNLKGRGLNISKLACKIIPKQISDYANRFEY